jgi:hypothetical protein
MHVNPKNLSLRDPLPPEPDVSGYHQMAKGRGSLPVNIVITQSVKKHSMSTICPENVIYQPRNSVVGVIRLLNMEPEK